MPEAPAATPVLSTTTTSSPALARCQAVDRPWTPAPITRGLTEGGGEGGMGRLLRGTDVAYDAMALPRASLGRVQPRTSQCDRASLPPAIPAITRPGKRPMGISQPADSATKYSGERMFGTAAASAAVVSALGSSPVRRPARPSAPSSTPKPRP